LRITIETIETATCGTTREQKGIFLETEAILFKPGESLRFYDPLLQLSDRASLREIASAAPRTGSSNDPAISERALQPEISWTRPTTIAS